jgi:cytochrome bd-type quinol oxidase subunit 2
MSTTAAATQAPLRRHLRPKVRRAVLSVHVISSVGLLGASAALLLLAVTAATTDDGELSHSAYRFMAMFGSVLGIPLSLTALISGLTLGLFSKWGVLRYPWVTIKLVLLVTTVLSGALVVGRGSQLMVDGAAGYETQLLVASTYNVVALMTSTVLSIFKPGKRRR